MTISKRGGFTIIELLFAMAIAAILITLVVPAFTSTLDAATKRTVTYSTLGLLNYARDQAVTHSSHTVICPAVENKCVSDWTHPLMLFLDNNRNDVRDKGERIFSHSDLINDEESLSWKSFGSKAFISFDEHGTTGFQSGRIFYCNNKAAPTVRAQIIVYRTGRSRVAREQEYKEGC